MSTRRGREVAIKSSIFDFHLSIDVSGLLQSLPQRHPLSCFFPLNPPSIQGLRRRWVGIARTAACIEPGGTMLPSPPCLSSATKPGAAANPSPYEPPVTSSRSCSPAGATRTSQALRGVGAPSLPETWFEVCGFPLLSAGSSRLPLRSSLGAGCSCCKRSQRKASQGMAALPASCPLGFALHPRHFFSSRAGRRSKAAEPPRPAIRTVPKEPAALGTDSLAPAPTDSSASAGTTSPLKLAGVAFSPWLSGLKTISRSN